MKERLRPFIIPASVSAAAIMIVVLGLSSALDWRIYDQLLRIRRAPVEDPSILLVDIDDPAITEIGTWPIGRDVIASGLATLGELGASSVTFDIEYVDPSPRGVDTRYLQDNIPESFAEGFGSLSSNIDNLFTALKKRQIPLSDAESYIQDLNGLTDRLRLDLLEKVRAVASDNDTELGRAARYNGRAYFTVNMRKEAESAIPPESQAVAVQVAGRVAPKSPPGVFPQAKGIIPTIRPILAQAAGAGFPNVYIDPDGVRRRIDLFYEYDGKLFAQLVMAPLLDYLGKPEIEASKGDFVLKGARLPDGKTVDIRIPRTSDGRMLLDWPHKTYGDSFRHVSFRELVVYSRLFADLAQNLRIRDNWGYFSAYQGSTSLAAQAAAIQERRRTDLSGNDEPPPGEAAQLDSAMTAFLTECKTFLDEKPEDQIMAEIDKALSTTSLDASTRNQYTTIQKDAPAYFSSTRGILNDLIKVRERLTSEVAHSFCIIGYTATGTTDIGVNPFSGEYVNVGTHAVTFNTILHRSFIRDLPWWTPLVLSLLITFGLSFLVAGRKPTFSIGVGMGTTAALAIGDAALFATTGVFLAPTIPLLSAFATFLSSTIVDFLRTEREKGFLRSAFSHYLSTDVIREIVANPDLLKLGGTKKTMTAMFTDIKGFSTISEKLGPEELVRLLNAYLTGMSDAILDLKGTIDKYEGDAIIAFFGAPMDLPDHAERCCRAAVRMKKLEAQLNVRFLEEGLAPSPLLTRIGINTGEMVVGNMGTDRKMDYTIIGDSVNLAARLEGVNKQYGTWICVAEDCVNAAGQSFLYRRLDRIRVVGKSAPIRIFELVDEVAQVTEEQRKFYAEFEEAMELFEARKWKEARTAFTSCLDAVPGDGPSKTYIGRCDTYLQNPPPANWDGVYNLTQK